MRALSTSDASGAVKESGKCPMTTRMRLVVAQQHPAAIYQRFWQVEQTGGSRQRTAHLLSDGRITQRVRGEVCDSLAAGISLGMDARDAGGVCGDRAGRCDSSGKPHTAAIGCTSPEAL